MKVAIVAGALLMVSAGLAFQVRAGGQEEHDPLLTDPEGDATEWNADAVRLAGGTPCRVYRPQMDTCREAQGPIHEATAGSGGVPAPPSMDLVYVEANDTPEHLVITLGVASLEPGLHGAADDDAYWYTVYWSAQDDPYCTETIWFLVDKDNAHETSGTTSLQQFWNPCPTTDEEYEAPSHRCGDWWWCSSPISYEIEYGSPGTIAFKIPRAAMTSGEQDEEIHHLSAQVRRRADQAEGVEAGYRLYSDPPVEAHGWWWERQRHYEVDVTERADPYTLETPMARPPPSTGEVQVEADRFHPDRADIDILEIGLAETPEALTFEMTLGEVSETPEDHQVIFALTLPSKRTYHGGYEARDGVRHPHLSYWAVPGEMRPIMVPVELKVDPGSPGSVSFTVDRNELDPIEAGTRLPMAWVATFSDDQGEVTEDLGPAATLWLSKQLPTDQEDYWDHGLPRYPFLHDTVEPNQTDLFHFEDAEGDAQVPDDAAVDGRTEAQLDVTYFQARPVSTDTTSLTIGVRDLSTLSVPTLYDALYYAFGVEVDGQTTMVGYYKDADDPAGDFLCAPDTTVLTAESRDPTQAVWTLIEGVVAAAHGAGGNGAGTPGSITMEVPHACLGAPPGDSLTIDRLEVATFLVRNPADRSGEGMVTEADRAASDGPLLLSAPSEPIATSAWYAAPFGVVNFWDIAGIGLAAVAMVAGGAVKLAQRRRDKRALAAAKLKEDRATYQEAVANAVDSGEDDNDLLQALRRRLGISEREHELFVLEAQAAAGTGRGLTGGELFLGRYRIRGPLGEGGFGRTLLATDEQLDRDVVLKVAHIESQREARRALREARALAKISHPNIVTVHDVEDVGGEMVLVLEHLPQGPLADRLADGRLAEAEALALVDDVLAGLEAAHAKGIVHRDVKPANILFAEDGRAKLADFGIARTEDGVDTLTGDEFGSNGAGTLRYMAPEQARGVGADERSDLYAVGAVLYEMLAGRPYLAFGGLSDLDARMAIVEDAPELPIEGVPEGVSEVLARALAKDPGHRPQSSSEMRQALARITTGAV